jgi:hypothetical protein
MVASIIISKSERDETLNHQHRRLIDVDADFSRTGNYGKEDRLCPNLLWSRWRGARGRAPL